MRVRCRGRVDGFAHVVSEWDLCVYEDETLHATIEPCIESGDAASAAGCSEESARLVLFDGQASHDQTTNVVVCRFRLALISSSSQAWIVACKARIDTADGSLSGSWSHVSATADWHPRIDVVRDNYPFDLHGTSIHPGESFRFMRPLSIGWLWLDGCLVNDETGVVTPCNLRIHLQNDGKLCIIFQEVKIGDGSWTDRECSFKFTALNSVELYLMGDAIGATLVGSWDSIAHHKITNESKWFEFVLVDSIRQWCPDNHQLFPRSFHLSAIECRASRTDIPCSIWDHVFSFTHEFWFKT